ncbi:MAG: histidine phosphatase family protein [Chloroflexi bacterium]|nr:histidine phosphatase family protein [Chloroflexota bacterium]
MKTLLILRHAKSSWSQPELTDYERPLNKRGQRDAPRMGQLLLAEDLVPDLIISSSAERALTTAETVAEACDYSRELRYTRNFYHAGPRAYIEALQKLDDAFQRVMVVGHNPGMEELLEVLTGLWERMPTAALAQLSLPISHWRELDEYVETELVNLWRPKEL